MVFMVCRLGCYGGGGIPAGKPQGTVALRGAGISGAKLLRKNCNRVANIDCMLKKNAPGEGGDPNEANMEHDPHHG